MNKGRFKTQALLDEGTVLACMAYVDLNPVRAGIAETPETSEYTSIKERIDTGSISEKQLQPISIDTKETLSAQTDNITSIRLMDYLNLVGWTGRQIRHGKTGSVPAYLEPILCRLDLNTDHWIDMAQHFGREWARNNFPISHLIFSPSLPVLQSQKLKIEQLFLRFCSVRTNKYRLNLSAK